MVMETGEPQGTEAGLSEPFALISGTGAVLDLPDHPAILANIHQKALAFKLQFRGWE